LAGSSWAALALWKLRLVLALLFFAFIIAAAMRPGIEWLKRHGVPRGVGLLLHYLGLFALVGLFLWIVVPRAVGQVQSALGADTKAQIHREAKRSKGIKHTILTAIDNRLRHLPKAGKLVHPAVTVTVRAFEVLLAISSRSRRPRTGSSSGSVRSTSSPRSYPGRIARRCATRGS
jgi:putative heme transporter